MTSDDSTSFCRFSNSKEFGVSAPILTPECSMINSTANFASQTFGYFNFVFGLNSTWLSQNSSVFQLTNLRATALAL
jgi:hypothetical protein